MPGRCFGRVQAPGGYKLDAAGEVDWLATLSIPFPWKAVAYAHLARDDTAEALRTLVQPRITSVRAAPPSA